MLEEFAASYAVGSLEADGEADDYRLHVAVCTVCNSLLMEYMPVARMLDEIDEREASPGLKNRLMASTRAHPIDAPAGEAQDSGAGGAIETRWRWTRPAIFAASAAAVIIAVLAVWNVNLQSRINDEQRVVSDWQVIGTAISSGWKSIELQGTESSPSSFAVVFKDPNANAGYVVFSNLPALDANKTFQLWTIADGTPRSMGLINYSDAVAGPIKVQLELDDAVDAIGVSTEPSGGSLLPTGPIVLLGETA